MNELERTLMTIQCRDTDAIPKVPGAGSMLSVDGEQVQLMHNGIKVVAGGYYGDWMSHVIRGLQGHHEPQEELVFHHLMRYVRHRTHFVELGSFWSYYALWYLKEVPHSTAMCIEPDIHHLVVGQRNARLNALEGRVKFMNAWTGGDDLPVYAAPTESSREAVSLPLLNMSALRRELGGKPIEVLHMDIQGHELPFIRSIAPQGDLRFIMVSTHDSSITGSLTTHSDCLEALTSLGAVVLVQHNVDESYSGDGFILASLYGEDKGLYFPPISRNTNGDLSRATR